MTILLLGGNGLLGHNVLKQLLQQGHVVHALLRKFSVLYADTFEHKDNLTIFEGSLLDDGALDRAAEGCDAIINCAGTTSMSLLHYEDYLPVNADLCDRLVLLMERHQIMRLVHTSTANTIGYGHKDDEADESSPIQYPFSRSFYALSKKEGEKRLALAACQHPDWHIVMVNPGFMIGAFDTKPSSGTLLLASYRKPLMLVPRGGKSFVSVEDVAVAIVNALTNGRHGQRYLLTGESLTMRDLYRIQARVCGYQQCLLSVPNWLLACLGRIGDLLRCCGVRTQLATRNVRQLMVCEYYDHRCATEDLKMPHTEISQAIQSFFDWYLPYKKRGRI